MNHKHYNLLFLFISAGMFIVLGGMFLQYTRVYAVNVNPPTVTVSRNVSNSGRTWNYSDGPFSFDFDQSVGIAYARNDTTSAKTIEHLVDCRDDLSDPTINCWTEGANPRANISINPNEIISVFVGRQCYVYQIDFHAGPVKYGYTVPDNNQACAGSSPTPTRTPTSTPRPPTPTTGVGTPTPTPDLTDTPTPTAGPAPLYSITGTVYVDNNNDGTQDPGEGPVNGAQLTLSGDGNGGTISDIAGNFGFTNLLTGNYSVRITLPPGYKASTPTTLSMRVGPNRFIRFGIIGTYTISGNVFNDRNKNRIKNAAEQNYLAGFIDIDSTGGSVQTSNGSYTINQLLPGTYTISYNNLPAPWQLVYPINGPPPSFTVTVGSGCIVDTTTGASCNASGNIVGLNFAITDSIPWIQGIGMDMRFDNGYDNTVPTTPSCTGPYGISDGAGNTPGIIFSGDTSARTGFGQASTTNWLVGGSLYPEVFEPSKSQLASSYASLLANLRKGGVTITNLQSVPGCNNLNNCSLPNNLKTIGSVFQANGNVVFNALLFQNNQNFIFLINGTLTIRGNIQVPTGSTAIFSAANDIIIDGNYGFAPACSSSNTTIDGIFSADNNVTIAGINNCLIGADRMVEIQGSVIVNASLSGGTFDNQRDLCNDNVQYPTVRFVERPDFILNLPDILRRKIFLYREVAP